MMSVKFINVSLTIESESYFVLFFSFHCQTDVWMIMLKRVIDHLLLYLVSFT